MPSAAMNTVIRTPSPSPSPKEEEFTGIEMHPMTLEPKEQIQKKIAELSKQITNRCRYMARVIKTDKTNPYLIKALGFDSLHQYLNFYRKEINTAIRSRTYWQEKLRHYFE